MNYIKTFFSWFADWRVILLVFFLLFTSLYFYRDYQTPKEIKGVEVAPVTISEPVVTETPTPEPVKTPVISQPKPNTVFGMSQEEWEKHVDELKKENDAELEQIIKEAEKNAADNSYPSYPTYTPPTTPKSNCHIQWNAKTVRYENVCAPLTGTIFPPQ